MDRHTGFFFGMECNDEDQMNDGICFFFFFQLFFTLTMSFVDVWHRRGSRCPSQPNPRALPTVCQIRMPVRHRSASHPSHQSRGRSISQHRYHRWWCIVRYVIRATCNARIDPILKMMVGMVVATVLLLPPLLMQMLLTMMMVAGAVVVRGNHHPSTHRWPLVLPVAMMVPG